MNFSKSSKKMQESQTKVGIVGAGPVGALLSIYLAKKGIASELYERRPDPKGGKVEAGRSINLAVSVRGIHALKEIGLEKEVLAQAIPMAGRMIHSLSGDLTFQKYGIHERDCIYSISRAGLNNKLLARAEESNRVQIHFEHKVTEFDLQAGKLTMIHEPTGKRGEAHHSTVIAADGASSVIRQELMKQPGAVCSQDYLDYGYKELHLPPAPGQGFLIEKNALHIWPRGTYMLIALPNYDGSFTCTLFLPKTGPLSFEALNSPESVMNFFKVQFGDIAPLIPDLTETFFSNPTGNMVTIKANPWYFQDRALLIGDAAHAMVPFFGQGMNCGFEDCTVLHEILAGETELANWEELFSKFFEKRKLAADRIADMALENFIEMRDRVGDPRFLMAKSVEKILESKFPKEYFSRYSLVTFSRVPYQVAHAAGVVENKILGELCRNLNKAEDVDLDRASSLIRTHLSPLFKEFSDASS